MGSCHARWQRMAACKLGSKAPSSWLCAQNQDTFCDSEACHSKDRVYDGPTLEQKYGTKAGLGTCISKEPVESFLANWKLESCAHGHEKTFGIFTTLALQPMTQIRNCRIRNLGAKHPPPRISQPEGGWRPGFLKPT